MIVKRIMFNAAVLAFMLFCGWLVTMDHAILRIVGMVLWSLPMILLGAMSGLLLEKKYPKLPPDEARQQRLDAAHEKFRQSIIDLVQHEMQHK